MSTLFVSDLDGTLLTNKATLSEFSRRALVQLLRDGMVFTVATARSVAVIRTILDGIPLELPVIGINGSFISDLKTGRHEVINSIERPLVEDIYHVVRQAECVPFISTFNGSEDCVYYGDIVNEGMGWYLNDRLSAKDKRWRWTNDLASSFSDQVVCLTIIGRSNVISELRFVVEECYGGQIQTQFFENQYSPGWYWLTIHDRRATKAQAIQTLRDNYGLDGSELVVFGDHNNDLEMFQIADRSIAMSNATAELKGYATQVIGSNEEDSVVRFLLDHWNSMDAGTA